MTKVLLGLGILAAVALAMIAGAGLHAWLDDETEVVDSHNTNEPLLTPAQVRMLVRTFLYIKIFEDTTGITYLCYPGRSTQVENLVKERLPDFEFEYVGNSLWLVSNEGCMLTVNDVTGKVTGPKAPVADEEAIGRPAR